MESGRTGPFERVLLVGFMGSGKTSVGRALSRLLGWPFRDFDEEIEAETGRTIPEIFRGRGESHFRRLEARIGRRLLDHERVVLASGGGWAVAPGRLDAVPEGTLTVWLRVSAEEAVRRVRSEGPERPLLDTEDPVARARELLAEREPSYQNADFVLDSESASPDGLARTILKHIRVHDAEEGVSHAKNG